MTARPAREQRSLAILDAAREVFCEKGYDATSVAEIAARVGVVEGTVYRYYDSKHDLLIQVLSHWYEQMFGDYSADLAGVSGARPRVRLLIWRHLRSIRDFPRLCRLMFREARDDAGEANAILRDLNRRYTRFLLDVLRDGAQSGEFQSDLDAALLRDLIYGGIEHYCWRYLCGHGELDIDAAADAITTVFCDGIGRDPSAQTLARETRRLESLVNRMEGLTLSNLQEH